MYSNQVIVFLVLISALVLAADVPRPRGVSLSRAALYRADKQQFTCLDGSLTIPFDQVNDDYCDCPDASDEPGTAACPHGTFHCTNAGHRPQNIAASRVNDGICDCCDASDEYHSKASCANVCNELGRNAREDARKKAELLRAGKELRAELAEKGAQLKKAKKEELEQLVSQRDESEKVLLEKDRLKKEIETQEGAALEVYKAIEEEERKRRDEIEASTTRLEAIEAFNKLDSNQNQILELHELQSRAGFDQDRNGEITDEEARYYLADQEALEMEAFITEAWSRVKPVMLIESGLFKGPPKGVGTVEEVPIGGSGQHDEEEKVQEPDHEDYQEEEEEHEEDDQETEDEEESEDYAPIADKKYDDATQELVDRADSARRDYTEADRNVKSIQEEIRKLEEYLQKDYGPEDEYATLEGECFEYHDYEYIYRLCPFDRTTQQQKSSSAETRLGTWSHWLTDTNTDDTARYDTMVYDHGQSCWNGPARTVHVGVTCGSGNRLTGVSEPNRCEYRFEFETPAACREGDAEEEEGDEGAGHDEL